MGKEALSISCSLKLNRDNCCLLCAVCYLWMGNWNGMECESRERERVDQLLLVTPFYFYIYESSTHCNCTVHVLLLIFFSLVIFCSKISVS